MRIFGNKNCEYFIEAVRNIDWDILFENENDLYEVFINRLTEYITLVFHCGNYQERGQKINLG